MNKTPEQIKRKRQKLWQQFYRIRDKFKAAELRYNRSMAEIQESCPHENMRKGAHVQMCADCLKTWYNY